LSVVDKFVKACYANNIRDRLWRVNVFAGAGLNAALVPLFRGPSASGTQYGNTVDQSLGSPSFGDADYTASAGLLGNGTSKYLDTGFNVDQLPGAANCHLSSFITGTQDIASARTLVGVLFNSVTDRYRLYLSSSTAGNYSVTGDLGKANPATVGGRANANGGLILVSRTSTISNTLYDDAVSIATNTTPTAETTGAFPFFVFARNGPTEFYNGRMAAYSIGAGMDSTQVAAYSTAMNALQTALGRA